MASIWDELGYEIGAILLDEFIGQTTPAELTEAISCNWQQDKFLRETEEGQELIEEIRCRLAGYPSDIVAKALKMVKSRRLIKRYVKERLPEEHPSHYATIAYYPDGKAMKYLCTMWPRCVKVIQEAVL